MLAQTAPLSLLEEGHNYGKTEQEALWSEKLEKYHNTLDYHDYIYKDDSLYQYINDIINNVKPAGLKDFIIKPVIVKSPNFNAAMHANGIMEINTGTLCKLDNEAQLAFIICHELAHFIERHALKTFLNKESIIQESSTKNGAIKREQIFEISDQYFEYSRNVEHDADSIGLAMLIESKYNALEAIEAMKKLPEIGAQKQMSSFAKFLIPKSILILMPRGATHYRKENRISFLVESSKEINQNGIINADEYKNRTHSLIRLNIDMLRSLMNSGSSHSEAEPFKLVQYINGMQTETPIRNSAYIKQLELIKAEIYQQVLSDPYQSAKFIRAKKNLDTNKRLTLKMVNEINKLSKTEIVNDVVKILNPLTQFDDIAYLAHRTLGLIYYDLGRNEEANLHFNTYLNSTFPISDRNYIKNLIKQ